MINKKKGISFWKPKKIISKQPKLKFPSYLTSHTKPFKVGKYIASKKRLSKMNKSSVIPFLMIGKPKYISKKNLSWPQAKRRFPMLNPYKDTDGDSVKNIFDCRPFNKRKQGFGHQYSFSFSSYPFTKTVQMTPNEFLEKTWEEGGRRSVYERPANRGKKVSLQNYKKQIQEFDRKTIDYLRKKIKSKKEKVAIGYIDMREGKPSGHEGRHTAIAAEEAGIKKIPVTVETEDEEDIREYTPVRETLQSRYYQDKKDDEFDKEEGLLKEEPIEFHEDKDDYNLKDEDDSTLDYDEEQKESQEGED